MELTFNQKLEVAAWISEKNNAAITGSIMLRLIGIELGREPQDIDIIIEDTDPDDIILPPLCTDVEFKTEHGYQVLKRCYFLGTKIEFIVVDKLKYKKHTIGDKSIDIAYVEDLYLAKIGYVANDSNEDYIEKTKKDIEILKNFFEQRNNENTNNILRGQAADGKNDYRDDAEMQNIL